MTRSPSKPACPRCGYDQSGAITTWSNSCPLQGTCPECGLSFRWLDVFHPDRDRVRGFFEHTTGFWPSLWAIPRTAWLVARPWTFWRRVQVHMQPRVARATGWLILMAFTLFALNAAFGLLAFGLLHTTLGRGSSVVWEDLVYFIGRPLLVPGGYTGSNWMLDVDLPDVLATHPPLLLASLPLWPLSFLLLPTTRHRCKLRTIHLWRGFVYTLASLFALYLPWIIESLLVALEVVLMAAEFEPPRALVGLRQFISGIEYSPRVGWLMTVLIWLWLALWWLFAIRRGFKLPHAWGVWLALLVINALATPLAFALCHILLARLGISVE